MKTEPIEEKKTINEFISRLICKVFGHSWDIGSMRSETGKGTEIYYYCDICPEKKTGFTKKIVDYFEL